VALRKDTKFQALVGRAPGGAWLVLPQSFMNASGRAVQMLAGFFKIPPAEILIVHDEVDFPPGTAKLKLGGGIAGHNGLKDISQRLGTHEYWRLRIGVGHPGHKDAVADYVLGRPSAEDRAAIDASIAKALEVLPLCLAGDVQTAMQKLHTEEKPEKASKAQEPAEKAAPPAAAPPASAAAKPEPAPAPRPAAQTGQSAKTEPAPKAEKIEQAEKTETGGALKSLLGSLLHPKRRK
jgi:PTH1 family peptidyl-tRNA hydrolase